MPPRVKSEFIIVELWYLFSLPTLNWGRSKGWRKSGKETEAERGRRKKWIATVTKTICFDIIYCLTTVLMMPGDSPCKWERWSCLWQLEALKDQRFLLSALFYGVEREPATTQPANDENEEKNKQAMFFKVSKKVSTTLFMIQLSPVGKFISRTLSSRLQQTGTAQLAEKKHLVRLQMKYSVDEVLD